METSVNNGMCRCCASEGAFKDVKSTYHWMGEEEIYADMLRDCFDINLHVSERGEEYSGICEVCITQLRNAINFKKQVLHTEEQFKKHMQNKSMFRPNIVKVEVQHEDSDDNIASGDDDFSADFEVPIKTEESEEPKPKKRAAKTVMTTRSKKTKIDIGETSTKRKLQGASVNIKSDIKLIDDVKFGRIMPLKIITPLKNPVKVTPPLNRTVKEFTPLNKPEKVTVPLKKPVKVTIPLKKPVKSTTPLNKPVKLNNLPQLNLKVKMIKTAANENETLGEINKHKHNIKEIMLWSNATPIKRWWDKGYVCYFCNKNYPDPADLKTHTLGNHNDITQVPIMKKISMYDYIVKVDITGLHCKICKKDMATTEILMDHLKDEHNKIIHTDIKNHIIPFKFSTDVLECFLCRNVFSKFKLLVRHMSIHYRNYICEVCDTSFINVSGYKLHISTHETGAFQCELCPLKLDTIVKKRNHVRKKHTHKKGRYKCGYCTETFTDYRQKEGHLVAAHGVKLETNKCQACDKVFKTRKYLAVHVKRDHLMERNHKCLDCDKMFFSGNSLKQHMLIHSGIKAHKCSVCLKSYSRSTTLKEHMRIHADDRRFKCDSCGQAFVQKCSWRNHMKTKHNEIV